jgi:hypothetical protein
MLDATSSAMPLIQRWYQSLSSVRAMSASPKSGHLMATQIGNRWHGP